MTGEGGLTGEGAERGDLGELAFLVGFGLGAAGVLADTGVFALTAVGAVLAVRVGLLGVGEAEELVVGEAGALAPITIAGCGSALAGIPEFIAMMPRVQVPTPRVPETAQAIADLDSGMVFPFDIPRLGPPDERNRDDPMRVLSSGSRRCGARSSGQAGGAAAHRSAPSLDE